MAWPTTPLTTYLPGSLPAIKSADLNSIQSAINRGFLGTYSYAGLVLDGAGGKDAVPVPGGINASGPIVAGGPVTVGGTAFAKGLPSPPPAPGAIYQDTRIIAAGFFYANAGLAYGYNIAGVARTNNIPNGSFTITMIVGSASVMLIPIANPMVVPAAYAQTSVNDGKTIRVDLYNPQGAYLDTPFYLIVVGG